MANPLHPLEWLATKRGGPVIAVFSGFSTFFVCVCMFCGSPVLIALVICLWSL